MVDVDQFRYKFCYLQAQVYTGRCQNSAVISWIGTARCHLFGKFINMFILSQLKSCTGHCQKLAADGGLVLQDLVNSLTCSFCPKLKSCRGRCQKLAADGGLVLQDQVNPVNMFFLS